MAIAISLNPYQFGVAKDKLAATEGCTISGNHLQTPWIDADFEYNEEAKTLFFTNEKKHGLTTFVSDKTIGEHISELIGTIPESAPETPEAVAVSSDEKEPAVSIGEHVSELIGTIPTEAPIDEVVVAESIDPAV